MISSNFRPLCLQKINKYRHHNIILRVGKPPNDFVYEIERGFFFFGVVSHEYQKFISSLINPKFKSLPIHLSGKLVN